MGIGYVLLKLNLLKNDLDLSRFDLKQIVRKIVCSDRKDDCLCHGNFGKASFMQNLLVNENRYMNEDTILKNQEDLFRKQFYLIRGMEEEPEYGLMTGLSGIAYEYIRYYDPITPNVLLLD